MLPNYYDVLIRIAAFRSESWSWVTIAMLVSKVLYSHDWVMKQDIYIASLSTLKLKKEIWSSHKPLWLKMNGGDMNHFFLRSCVNLTIAFLEGTIWSCLPRTHDSSCSTTILLELLANTVTNFSCFDMWSVDFGVFNYKWWLGIILEFFLYVVMQWNWLWWQIVCDNCCQKRLIKVEGMGLNLGSWCFEIDCDLVIEFHINNCLLKYGYLLHYFMLKSNVPISITAKVVFMVNKFRIAVFVYK